MTQDFETNKKRIERLGLTCNLTDDDGKIHYFQDGHEFVEIGGIKWATCNVGAERESDKGLYFQWGDIQGYTIDQVGNDKGKKFFGWADYMYGNDVMNKYNPIDGKRVLEASDDAARFHMGGSWRMPTVDDFRILLANTTNKWVINYKRTGVIGRVFTSKIDSSKTLFFPACGCCSNGSRKHMGIIGFYWSSSLNSSSAVFGGRFFFDSRDCNVYHSYRFGGFPVRGVVG